MIRQRRFLLHSFAHLLQNISALVISTILSAEEPRPPQLMVQIAATTDSHLLRTWIGTGIVENILDTAPTILRPNQQLHLAFLVSGASPDNRRRANFSIHWKLLRPDGSKMFGEENYAHGREELVAIPDYQMANPALDIILDRDDLEGEYRLEATVEDKIAHRKATTAYRFSLQKE